MKAKKGVQTIGFERLRSFLNSDHFFILGIINVSEAIVNQKFYKQKSASFPSLSSIRQKIITSAQKDQSHR